MLPIANFLACAITDLVAFTVLKVAGRAYMIFLGIQPIWHHKDVAERTVDRLA